MKFKLENVESEKAKEIVNLIREYNSSNRESSKSELLNIYMEDEQGNILAGMVAETFGNWLEIEYLYVRDDFRGKGIGSKILEKAEKESKSRGCKYSFVNTFNFQSPNFYKKHGYKEVFALNEYPYTGERYYYTKVLWFEIILGNGNRLEWYVLQDNPNALLGLLWRN